MCTISDTCASVSLFFCFKTKTFFCGEALLPKDLAVFSSLFPFGYSENEICYHFSILSTKKHIAALALLRCSIIVKNKHNSSLVIALNCSPSLLLPQYICDLDTAIHRFPFYVGFKLPSVSSPSAGVFYI
jgi:hypothetical protein